MAAMNKVILLGKLTRDPETRQLPNQTTVANFGLAINERFKGSSGESRERVTFVDVVAFGRTAELVAKYRRKGDPLLVEGRLKFDTWEDKNGGGKRSKLSVQIDSMQFIGGNGKPRQNAHDEDGPRLVDEYSQVSEEEIPF